MSFFLANCSSPLDNVYEPSTYNTSLREIRDYDSSAADKIDDQISYCSYNLESGIKFQEILDGYNKRLELSKRVLERYVFISDSVFNIQDSIKNNALSFKIKSIKEKSRNRKDVELEIKNISGKDILYFIYTPFVFEDNYKTDYSFFSDRFEIIDLASGQKTIDIFELYARSNKISALSPNEVRFNAQRLKVLFKDKSVIDVNLSDNIIYEAALTRLITPLISEELYNKKPDEFSESNTVLEFLNNDNYKIPFQEFCTIEENDNNTIYNDIEKAYLSKSEITDSNNFDELTKSYEKYSRDYKIAAKIAANKKVKLDLYKSKKNRVLNMIREKIIKAAEGSTYKLDEKLVYKIFDEIKLHFQYSYLELDDIIITQRDGVDNQFYFQVVTDGVKTMKRGPIMVFSYD